MAYEFYLKLEHISGEATADKHKGEIEVLSWSWGANQMGGGTGGGARVFKFVHVIDKSSPQLLNFACTGKSPGLGTIKASKVMGKRSVDYLFIKLSQTLIESIDQAGQGLGAPHEEVTISFDAVEEDYTVIKADGTKGNTFHGECGPRL